MKITKATQKNIPNLAQLLWEFSQDTWKEFQEPRHKPKPKKEFIPAAKTVFKQRLEDGKHIIFIAEEQEPIGMLVCRIDIYQPSLYEISESLYMEWLFVRKEHRRNKIATQLVEKAFEEVKTRNIKLINVTTPIESPRNIKFYESLGFDKKYHQLYTVID